MSFVEVFNGDPRWEVVFERSSIKAVTILDLSVLDFRPPVIHEDVGRQT
jgi:hypothetical protein